MVNNNKDKPRAEQELKNRARPKTPRLKLKKDPVQIMERARPFKTSINLVQSKNCVRPKTARLTRTSSTKRLISFSPVCLTVF